MNITARSAFVSLLVGLVVLAGWTGVWVSSLANTNDADPADDRFRLVVRNDLDANRTVRITLVNDSGKKILDDSKSLRAGGTWIVSTLNVSSLDTPVTVNIRVSNVNSTVDVSPIRSTTRGSRLHVITDDGIDHHECNVNVTCWQSLD